MFSITQEKLAAVMRDVFSSVSKDVITASVKKCGFSITGYNPCAIPDSAYSHGKAYRFKEYPASDDKGYQEKLFAEENITAPPGTLNLCIDTPTDISFQENASKREQAQARTDLAECPILKTLDDEVSVAKRAFSTAERAGLPPEVCTLASSGAVAALNSKSPRHVCDVICKVSALASGISDATLASSHALDSITLGLLDVPLTRSVQTFWVTPGLTTTEIRNDQVVITKS